MNTRMRASAGAGRRDSLPSGGGGANTKTQNEGDMNMSTTILNEWTGYGSQRG